MRWTLVAVPALLATAAAANPVYDMCVHPGTYGKEQCDCAASRLLTAFSLAERELFGALSSAYLAQLDDGLGMADAWDGAVQAEARARSVGYVPLKARSDDLGERWTEILDRCGG